MNTPSDNSLMKPSDNIPALFEQLEEEYQHRMVFLQKQYEGADATTPEGQALIGEITTLVDEANKSRTATIEIRQQLGNLKSLSNVQASLISMLREHRQGDINELRGLQVRLNRLKESKKTRREGDENTSLYNHMEKQAANAARNGLHR